MKSQGFTELLDKITNNIYTEKKLNISVDSFAKCYEGHEEYTLTDAQILLLVEALKKNSNVTELNLSGNRIGDEGAIALASLDSIKILVLSSNNITEKGAIALFASKVSELYLSENKIKIDNFEAIEPLIQNKNIVRLDLQDIFTGGIIIGKLIKYNNTIKDLYLGKYLDDGIFEFIGENKTIEELWIDESHITDLGIKFLANNNSLKTLYIRSSEVTNVGAEILSEHQSLKELSLRESKITFEGTQSFVGSNLNKVTLNSQIISLKQYEYFEYAFEEGKKVRDLLLQKDYVTEESKEMIIAKYYNEDNFINLNGESEWDDYYS